MSRPRSIADVAQRHEVVLLRRYRVMLHLMLEAVGPTIAATMNAGRPFYAGVLIGTSLLLFLPDSLIAQMSLIDFRNDYRPYLGGAFIGSASLLGAEVFTALASFPNARWKQWRFNVNARAALSELTEDEKQFLCPFIFGGANTQYAPYYDGIVRGLEAKTIIYRASDVSVPGNPGIPFPWNLQPYARKILKDFPDLLS